jgi:glucokinase
MVKNDDCTLLGDIGGTHLRLAWAKGETLSAPQTLLVSQYASLESAVAHFLREQKRDRLDAAAFAIAGLVADGRASMTNLDWRMDERALARALKAKRVQFLNDFTAAALGIPHLKESELTQIGGGAPRPEWPKALIGPGTGLGVSGLVPDSHGHFTPLYTEGGHVDLPASNARELAVLAHLLPGHVHVSAERVLSGDGLAKLYGTLAAIDGVPVKNLTAAEITAAAGQGDARAKETLQLFSGWLGAVAGNLALTLGAQGGVYLCGGILPRLGPLFDRKLFRARFEAKGRMRVFLEPIPVYLIRAEDLALRGLAALAISARP